MDPDPERIPLGFLGRDEMCHHMLAKRAGDNAVRLEQREGLARLPGRLLIPALARWRRPYGRYSRAPTRAG